MYEFDLPEVRLREPAFSDVTRRAGLTSIDAIRDRFDLELVEVHIAVHGGPVSPGFVASVLMTFPDHKFRELFELNIYSQCSHG